MTQEHKREWVIFFAINLIAPAIYSWVFLILPEGIALYVTYLMFFMFQAANLWRIRSMPRWRIAYLVIILANISALVLIGMESFFTALPAAWGIITNLHQSGYFDLGYGWNLSAITCPK